MQMAATREDVPKQLYNDQNCEVTVTQESEFTTHTVEVIKS